MGAKKATCCQTGCSARKRAKGRNQKETDWSIRSDPVTLPAGAKRKYDQLFLTGVKLTNGPDFPIPWHFVPYATEFYCLGPVASGHLGSPAPVRLRWLLPIWSHVILSAVKRAPCVRRSFVPEEKKEKKHSLKRDLSRSVSGQNLFHTFPFSSWLKISETYFKKFFKTHSPLWLPPFKLGTY